MGRKIWEKVNMKRVKKVLSKEALTNSQVSQRFGVSRSYAKKLLDMFGKRYQARKT
jgi:hypothetical protein